MIWRRTLLVQPSKTDNSHDICIILGFFWTLHLSTQPQWCCARYHAVGATFLARHGREWKDPDVEVHFKEMINQVNLNFKNIFNLFFPDPLMWILRVEIFYNKWKEMFDSVNILLYLWKMWIYLQITQQHCDWLVLDGDRQNVHWSADVDNWRWRQNVPRIHSEGIKCHNIFSREV